MPTNDFVGNGMPTNDFVGNGMPAIFCVKFVIRKNIEV